jgi:hypothetical protein
MTLWFSALLAICAAVVIVGRAHSRYLDRLDDEHARGFLNDQRVRIFARRPHKRR